MDDTVDDRDVLPLETDSPALSSFADLSSSFWLGRPRRIGIAGIVIPQLVNEVDVVVGVRNAERLKYDNG